MYVCMYVLAGPGPGALSRVLHQRYPNMTAIEVDQRAVAFLATKIPGLNVINMVGRRADILVVYAHYLHLT